MIDKYGREILYRKIDRGYNYYSSDGTINCGLEGDLNLELALIYFNRYSKNELQNESNITNIEFLDRFTEQERQNIISSDNLLVKDLYGYCLASKTIDLKSDRVINSLKYLESLGLITNERIANILGEQI